MHLHLYIYIHTSRTHTRTRLSCFSLPHKHINKFPRVNGYPRVNVFPLTKHHTNMPQALHARFLSLRSTRQRLEELAGNSHVHVFVLQYVAVCCCVLQRVAVCCSALPWCSVLQCVAACCSVLQYVGECCSRGACGAFIAFLYSLLHVECLYKNAQNMYIYAYTSMHVHSYGYIHIHVYIQQLRHTL